MINRISTAGQHTAAVQRIMRQQVQLEKTQSQVASGKRVETPADDPIAATRILGYERSQAQLEQFERNSTVVQQRLSAGETALADLGTLLDRIYQLAVQASTGSIDDSSLGSLAAEVQARSDELLQLSNRQDANGEYLYSGYSTGTRPFSQSGNAVSYAGDQGVRKVQIGATQAIADSFTGSSVFLGVKEGNGVFAVSPGVHAGAGVLGVTEITDRSAWNAAAAAAATAGQPHNYTVQFIDTDGDGTVDGWEALDAGGAQVATGDYASDSAIAFDGIQISVSGKPAVGDTYAVEPAGTESLFDTVTHMITALQRGAGTEQLRSQLSTDMNKAIRQLQNGMDHANNLRAEIGTRLATIDTTASTREDMDYQLADSLSKLRDLDYAEAIARLNQQEVGLKAAQAAYARIGQMSLFDYL